MPKLLALSFFCMHVLELAQTFRGCEEHPADESCKAIVDQVKAFKRDSEIERWCTENRVSLSTCKETIKKARRATGSSSTAGVCSPGMAPRSASLARLPSQPSSLPVDPLKQSRTRVNLALSGKQASSSTLATSGASIVAGGVAAGRRPARSSSIAAMKPLMPEASSVMSPMAISGKQVSSSSAAGNRARSVAGGHRPARSSSTGAIKHSTPSTPSGSSVMSMPANRTVQRPSGKELATKSSSKKEAKQKAPKLIEDTLQDVLEKKTPSARMEVLSEACSDDTPCLLRNACSFDDLVFSSEGTSGSGQVRLTALLSARRSDGGEYKLEVHDFSAGGENGELLLDLSISNHALKIDLVQRTHCSEGGAELLRWIEFFAQNVLCGGLTCTPSIYLDDDAKDKNTNLVLRYGYPLRMRSAGSAVTPDKFESWYEANGFSWIGTLKMGKGVSTVAEGLIKLKHERGDKKSNQVGMSDWVQLKADVLKLDIGVVKSALSCSSCTSNSFHSLVDKLHEFAQTFGERTPPTLFDALVYFYDLFVKSKKQDTTIIDLSSHLASGAFRDLAASAYLSGNYKFCKWFGEFHEPRAYGVKCFDRDFEALVHAERNSDHAVTKLFLLADFYANVGEFRKTLQAA